MANTEQLTRRDINCFKPVIYGSTQTQSPPLQFPLWKRILDITCVLLALPFIAPIGFVIAIFIKIVSPGPAFFRQPRVGFFGRKMMCLKFRTMKVNADTGVHQNHLKELMMSNGRTNKLDAKDKRLITGWVDFAGYWRG